MRMILEYLGCAKEKQFGGTRSRVVAEYLARDTNTLHMSEIKSFHGSIQRIDSSSLATFNENDDLKRK